MAHTWLLHIAEEFGPEEHWAEGPLHDPQWSGSVFRFTSHPFAETPSQFPKPLLQVKLQMRFVHAGTALVAAEHWLAAPVHEPQ